MCARQCQAWQPQHRPVHPAVSPCAPIVALLHLHPSNTYDSEIFKRPRLLNVLQRLLQIPQLLINHTLRLLCRLNSLSLEALNSLDLPVHIVRLGLESLELLLDVIDDGLVLEDRSVVGEVHALRLLGEDLKFPAGVVVALLEGLEGGGGLASETELCAEALPVDFECGTAL